MTEKKAALFTDGRYFLQASQELDPTHWKLMKQGDPGVPTWQEYLVKVRILACLFNIYSSPIEPAC